MSDAASDPAADPASSPAADPASDPARSGPGDDHAARRSAQRSDWRSDPAWPAVDVIMPIRNEVDNLAAAVDSVRDQQYPGPVRLLVAVGPSDDGTEAVAARLADTHDDVIVLDNPTGRTPAALNTAIRAGSAPVIVRVDGHSRLSPGYIERAVRTLRRTHAVNVGGRQVPVPTSDFERAVAVATTSWMGTGGATYRVGGPERNTDTVYLGVFDRSAVESVGLFDERLTRNQDYELNIRLRATGGTIVFDPGLAVDYRPRGDWRSLSRQYFEYGTWKSVVMRMHPRWIRPRQIAAPVGLTTVLAGLVIGRIWRPAFAPAVAYLVGVGSVAARGRRPLLVSAVLVVVHSSWVAGLLTGLTRRVDRRR